MGQVQASRVVFGNCTLCRHGLPARQVQPHVRLLQARRGLTIVLGQVRQHVVAHLLHKHTVVVQEETVEQVVRLGAPQDGSGLPYIAVPVGQVTDPAL